MEYYLKMYYVEGKELLAELLLLLKAKCPVYHVFMPFSLFRYFWSYETNLFLELTENISVSNDLILSNLGKNWQKNQLKCSCSYYNVLKAYYFDPALSFKYQIKC